MNEAARAGGDFSADALARVLFEELALAPEARLWVAFSGGLDSHVLLHALTSLGTSRPLTLTALHADHGLMPEADAWASHCENVCSELGVELITTQLSLDRRGGDLEQAARRARYAWLGRFVGAGELLLTAHHRDDQAETLLLALMRGAGVDGLSAMPVVRPFAAGRLMRPLLGFGRDALRAYAEGHRLRWLEDPSNADPRFDRNYVRARVLPALSARWPSAARALARSAGHLGEARRLLDDLAAMDLQTCRAPGAGARLARAPALAAASLAGLSSARARNLLRRWVREAGLPPPPSATLAELERRFLGPASGAGGRVAWAGAEVRRYRDRLYLAPTPAAQAPQAPREWAWQAPLDLPELGLRLSARAVVGAGVARSRCGTGVTLCWRRGGERVRLAGRRHRHRLKKLLQQSGVPPWERSLIPLVVVGGEIAALPGLFVFEPFAAGAGEEGLEFRVEPLETP